MKTLSKLAISAVAAMVLSTQVLAQQTHQTHQRIIVVSLEDRRLALVEDGQVMKVYPVAVGKPSTPSPVGTFTIANRTVNPTYHHAGRTVLPGPGNPVGSRWMGLSIGGYGIHGTNEPGSIGKAASHGCIRMAKADLEALYPLVATGDTVELVGTRNEQTAQLFGVPIDDTTAATEPMLTAEIAPVAPVLFPIPAPEAAPMPTLAAAAEPTVAALAGTR